MSKVPKEESATKAFLLDLLHITGTFLTSGCRVPPDIVLDRRAYEALCRSYERRVARQAMRRLKEQKLIAVKAVGERMEIALTAAGRNEVLKLEMLRTEKKLPRNEYCLVSFDVPEVTKQSRDALRHFLKEMRFEQVHRSVWVSDRDVVKPMKELVRSLHAEKWIRIFRARDA